MSVSYGELILDEADSGGNLIGRGTVTIALSQRVPDAGDDLIFGQAPVTGVFRAGGPPSVRLPFNDTFGPQGDDAPGTTYTITYNGVPGSPASWSFYFISTNGGTQRLSAIASTPAAQPGQMYVPLPGTPPSSDSQVLGLSSDSPLVTEWVSSPAVPGSLIGLAPSGDETGATDKANIQALLNVAGRSVLQAGHFYINGALTVHSGDTLAGAGAGSTDTSDYVTLIEQLSTTADGIQGTDVDTLTFSGFALKGPGSGTGVGISLTWLDFTNTPYTDFANLLVAGFGSHGIAINTTVNCAMRRVVSHANGGDGFHLTGNGTSGSFSACWGTDNTGYGWYVNDCNYYSWNGCGADGNANGWYFTDCESIAVNGCGAEANTTDAFTVDASLSVEINGLWLYGNNHYGVHLTSTAYRVKISGVTESSPGGSAAASIITDAGSIATLENNTLITATALNGTATVLGDGTLSMPGGASVSGLTATGAVGGYTQSGRFTGFTFGGAPSGGTFATRDWALDAVNHCLWICTAGGTPGTWVSAGLVAGNNLSDVASRQTSINNLAGAVTAAAFLRGNGTNIALSAIQASDVPTLNQSTSGNAATATTAAACSGNAATATNLAGGATFPAHVAPTVTTLADGSSVALNAALGNDFRWSLGGSSHTLATPTNPVNGQSITIAIKYGGSYTPLFTSAVYDFGAAGQPSWSAASGKTDYAGFRYDSALNAAAGAWAYQGCILGLTS